jgi:hypothetical protein
MHGKRKPGALRSRSTIRCAATRDPAPPALLDTSNVKTVPEKFRMLAVFKNGPRLWALDWVEVKMERERDFGGMKARSVNWHRHAWQPPEASGRLEVPVGGLEEDLILTPDKTGTAHITQDNFGNTYDRAGGAYSNVKP